MIFYFLLIAVSCGLCMMEQSVGPHRLVINGKVYAQWSAKYSIEYIAVGTLLLLFAFIRRPDLGTDSPNYIYHFSEALKGIYATYEVGYTTLVKVFQKFSSNYQLFIVLCSSITLIPILHVIKQEASSNLWIAIYLFITTQYVATFSVLRGSISLAFLFLAYRHIDDSSRTRFFLYSLCALLFHNTSIVVIVLLLVGKHKYRFHHYCLTFLASPLFLLPQVSSLIIANLRTIDGRYTPYTVGVGWSGSFVMVLVFLFFTVLCAVYYNRLLERNPKNIVLINISAAMLLFNTAFHWFPALTRIVTPNLAFMCLLAPEIVACEPDKHVRALLTIVFVVLFGAFMLLNVNQGYSIMSF